VTPGGFNGSAARIGLFSVLAIRFLCITGRKTGFRKRRLENVILERFQLGLGMGVNLRVFQASRVCVTLG
jgi:hypothetical protein